ncbi:undecaprenyl-diphosphate phosphatase [Phenylobacterium sp.]|uniref:undecaprenyl-diphosphate phosphatase n=1 Tax=Phenylobacterium sp. TaxID=1871053 RepID=UPI001208E48B|nr:undecaprenyl-diphosphate phosphatase [Phenylobacterium sp.]THD63627.1 MAG: undecaprenyl-diphosphate phosphatase [Phenylobacterium sp.]
MSDKYCSGVDVGFVGLGYAKVALLGVIQGITELLPISSTAHMRVVPAFLGWSDPGAAFSAAMQAAALVAVASYFWRDLAAICGGSAMALKARRFQDKNLRLGLLVAVATAPIAVGGLLLSPVLNACNSPLRSLPAIGCACLVMAALLAVAEIFARHTREASDARLRDGLLIGLAQVGALIPGVSRSGSTLTAALGLGFRREEAARLSFLLGMPAIALAGGKELWELHKAHLSHHGWSVLALGIAVAALSSFVTIWSLMRFLERFSAWPFVAYRALLGVVILGGVFLGKLA